mmetsp:Transcript_4750/g.13722  ORF Transcript_4750/g.13722 Transcript_4750/m.13722 type:complete len:214 (+) Transcript_4750:792-1433(+)
MPRKVFVAVAVAAVVIAIVVAVVDVDDAATDAQIAHTSPVAADPQTFSGPRFPPRPSAMPLACFSRNLTLVTADPRNRYRTQVVQPLQPRVVHSPVPSASAWTNPSRVRSLRSLGRRTANKKALRPKDCNSGTLPAYEKRDLVRAGIGSGRVVNAPSLIGGCRCCCCCCCRCCCCRRCWTTGAVLCGPIIGSRIPVRNEQDGVDLHTDGSFPR